MDPSGDRRRQGARALAQTHLERGDPLGWFEALYDGAGGDPAAIPWADLAPNPALVTWLNDHVEPGAGRRALKIGCGLGDDAEALARRGLAVTAFDVSATAIAWCRRRFPGSPVDYQVADLLAAPTTWRGRFDLVVESYTLQVLPPELRARAIAAVAGFVAPGGELVVICRGRDPEDDRGAMPWPLTRGELDGFVAAGLDSVDFVDFVDHEEPPVRRFLATFRRRPDDERAPNG